VKPLAVPGPPPGPWDAKAALVHNKQAADVAKAARDIRGNFRDDAILRDDAMTISCDRKRSEDTDGSLSGFEIAL
jgi:hypothetical protein